MNKTILCLEDQMLIFNLREKGFTGYEIIKKTGFNKKTVYKYIKKDKFTIYREVNKKLGRKNILTVKKKNLLIEKSKIENFDL